VSYIDSRQCERSDAAAGALVAKLPAIVKIKHSARAFATGGLPPGGGG